LGYLRRSESNVCMIAAARTRMNHFLISEHCNNSMFVDHYPISLN
jgi:hypothetical protein